MQDPRVENLAKILVYHSIKVKPNDWVLIRGNSIALPLVNEVLRHVLRAGGNPTFWLDNDDLAETLISEASPAQLEWISPVESLLTEKIDAFINLRSTNNTRSLTGTDPQKQRLSQLARRDLHQLYLKRSAEGNLRWTLTIFPCNAYAQEADMSLRDYEDFVYSAVLADQPDPIQAWLDIYERQERLVAWLKGKRQVTLHGPNCDLTLSIADRKFINCAGSSNIPDGEIFTGPVEDSAAGWMRFTYPAIINGREVEGAEFEFKEGKVINARARKNQDFLSIMLDSDPGARYLGEFAIGTNYGIKRFTKNILFDEKIGGSVHVAVGAGYPETGSQNQSSIHWDFICDMREESEICVDGELFYKNGEFMI